MFEVQVGIWDGRASGHCYVFKVLMLDCIGHYLLIYLRL